MTSTSRRRQPSKPVRALFLVGFMGSGKTSVGQALSRHLAWDFVDLDARVEASQGCSIAEIFRNLGEAGFRQAEREALLELLTEMQASPAVAALGGGAFVQPENLAALENSGIPAVFLDAPLQELWERCRSEKTERPLAQSLNQFRQLYEARRPIYMKAALRIQTSGKDVAAIAAEVISRLGLNHEGKEK
ncbi:MAG TPA: shikimate kinase [Terriglobales bacterium]|nr:shikimate kinase [Terriglobales bacterium]